MENEKRFFRQLKRDIKKTGNRDRRNFLKRELRDNPEEAHWSDFEFGKNSSEYLNGKFTDPTRNRD